MSHRPNRQSVLIQVQCTPELAAWIRRQAYEREMFVSTYVRGVLLQEYRKRHNVTRYRCGTCHYHKADYGPGKCLNRDHCANYLDPLEAFEEGFGQ